MRSYLENILDETLKFLRSTDFSKAVILTISIGLPVALFVSLGHLEIGIAIAVGCLLSSPGDVAGSFSHKFTGVFLAAILAGIASTITGYAAFNVWVLIPVMGFLMFGISYLAVYGFRASLVAFSGLFAIVLSFANVSTALEIWERGVLITMGGLWYLSLSSLWYFINPRHQSEQLLAGCLDLTGKYLKTRAELIVETDRREELKENLFSLQTQLNESHENLREMLISSGRNPGRSNYARKRLLIFIEVVDILELAMANPVNYEKMDALFENDNKVLFHFKDIIYTIARELEKTASKLDKKSRFSEKEVREYFQEVDEHLTALAAVIDIKLPTESAILLKNLYDYQEKQTEKVKNILRTLSNLENRERIFMKQKEVTRFISVQDYDVKILFNNFHFRSPIFKHSLRLALVVLAGFSIGIYFSIENAYWIILTIIVIMRPNYGLTRQRYKARIIGTLLGGAIAVGIVFIFHNLVLFAILALFSLTMAFSLIQRNYKTAAVFITLSIIFIYSLLQPDVLNVIQFRVIDTVIGAVLAALGNIILWPAWESQGLKKLILESLRANRKFLIQIDKFYHKKKNLPTSYKLARKQAFLEMGNLSASLERMKQEPKSRQKNVGSLQEIVDLNQTFLSALASLGTYIQNHKTTRASKDFEIFIEHISQNLKNIENNLENIGLSEATSSPELQKAKLSLDKKFDALIKRRTLEIKSGKINLDKKMQLELQEAQLISEQLKWLLALSEKLERRIKAINIE